MGVPELNEGNGGRLGTGLLVAGGRARAGHSLVGFGFCRCRATLVRARG